MIIHIPRLYPPLYDDNIWEGPWVLKFKLYPATPSRSPTSPPSRSTPGPAASRVSTSYINQPSQCERENKRTESQQKNIAKERWAVSVLRCVGVARSDASHGGVGRKSVLVVVVATGVLGGGRRCVVRRGGEKWVGDSNNTVTATQQPRLTPPHQLCCIFVRDVNTVFAHLPSENRPCVESDES